MNIIKQEKGITIVSVVLIIVVLFVILGVSLYYSDTNINTTVDSKLNGELKMIQNAILQQYAKYKATLNEDCIIGTDYSTQIESFMNENYNGIQLICEINENTEKYKRYYLLTIEDLEKIGVNDSEYSYIVNYYTGEVLNATTYKTSSNNSLYIKGTTSTGVKESY